MDKLNRDEGNSVPPISYTHQDAETEWVFVFDDKNAPVDSGYRAQSVTVKLATSINFTASQYSAQGFRENSNSSMLTVQLRWLPVEASRHKSDRAMTWYADRLEELDRLADMPDYVRVLLERALARIAPPPKYPA